MSSISTRAISLSMLLENVTLTSRGSAGSGKSQLCTQSSCRSPTHHRVNRKGGQDGECCWGRAAMVLYGHGYLKGLYPLVPEGTRLFGDSVPGSTLRVSRYFASQQSRGSKGCSDRTGGTRFELRRRGNSLKCSRGNGRVLQRAPSFAGADEPTRRANVGGQTSGSSSDHNVIVPTVRC